MKGALASTILYPITITSTKISILLLYRRIFITPKFKLATSIVGAICVIWLMTAILGDLLQCRPIAGASELKGIPYDHARCMNHPEVFFWFISLILLATDVIILCLPISMIWKLKMCIQQKIVLSAMFLLGGL